MNLSFRWRIMVIIFAACLICTVTSVIISGRGMLSQGEESLVAKSQAILSRLEVARDFVATQGGLDEIIKRMVELHPDGNLSQESKIEVLKKVPIFVSMKIGSTNADKENYQFRIFTDRPRNEKNKATAEEMQIFSRFERDPALKEIVEQKDGKVAVYRPVLLSESQGCLNCHGSPAQSPWKNGKDILGYPMEDWKDGKLKGVFGIISELAPVRAEAMASTWSISGWTFLGLICSLALGLYFLRGPIGRLGEVSASLKASGEDLARASSEIADSSRSLSSASTQAAASLEETTASTEEMSSMIVLNAKNAEEARKLSTDCEQKARRGQGEVSQLIDAMREIQSSSKKIEEIISVIDDIAFQTNLLALNAAVEAARAGEQGKGFAVVAEAVQALAQRSSSSAKEISDLIKTSVDSIHKGSDIAERSGRSLTEIVSSVEKMSHLNTEISNASQEQSQGVQSINAAINELDKVTQQNASASEQTAASSEVLHRQSEQLADYVHELLQVIQGDKAA